MKFDKAKNEREIEKLEAEIKLYQAIMRMGLRETLRALISEYSLQNVELYLRRIASAEPTDK